jgi:Helix-turn-helix domain
MFKAFKFRLWTNANQERELGIMLETHRRLYNAALAQRQWFYNEWNISRSYADQSGWFKAERADNRWFVRSTSAARKQRFVGWTKHSLISFDESKPARNRVIRDSKQLIGSIPFSSRVTATASGSKATSCEFNTLGRSASVFIEKSREQSKRFP